MKKREKPFNHKKSFMAGILSLSLLTVMAGAAVAPALGVIQAYFSYTNPLFVQMIISIPAIFIVITNFIFPKLCRTFGAKTLVMIGLLFYTAGGCAAGLFSNIALVLAMRALVGIGVGIIMPLSTGLLAFYFPPRMQGKLMGQSSAMNQMGGVVATLLSGILAGFSWRASFLVYLMGLISIVLCGIFMPDEKIQQQTEDGEKKNAGRVFRDNYVYVVGMFLLMTIFFIYPSNFAMETVADGAGIPFIISEASMKAGKSAAVTVLPLISVALYLAQFLCPVIMSAVTAVLGGIVPHLPYYFAALLALIFCLWSSQIRHE